MSSRSMEGPGISDRGVDSGVVSTQATHSASTKRGGVPTWGIATGLVISVGLIWGGWSWWNDQRYQSAMAEIEAQVVGKRYGVACRNLEALLLWNADKSGGVHYLLGSCELARGRSEAAGEAWAAVRPGSEFSERAIRGRMRLLHDAGKIAAAEELIGTAAMDPRNDRAGLKVLLVPIYIDMGRSAEAARLIEERWNYLNLMGQGALEPALKLVRQHVDVTTKLPPVEAVRNLLEQAAKLAPDDERIWLGRANLAIRTGDYAEAERWIDKCEWKGFNNAVWDARIRWAKGTERIDLVKKILGEHPELERNWSEHVWLEARMARQSGDAVAERKWLEQLLGMDRSELWVLDRLAELATKEGQPARARELLDKKAELSRLRTRYLTLHERRQPIRDAEEMAELADQLGRSFESRGFLTIALGQDPDREDLKKKLKAYERPPSD